jgi:hypothetical protein
MISRRGIALDVLSALLVVPVWSYCGAIIALVSALVVGLALRFVVYMGKLKAGQPFQARTRVRRPHRSAARDKRRWPPGLTSSSR